MLTPSSAASRATALNAPAVIGRPSTKMVCVDGSRMIGTSSLRSMLTSRPKPRMADSTSWRNCVPSATSGGQQTRTPSVSRLRTTTCSTLSNSTPCRDSTSNSAEVTPGWSTPVTVMSTDTLGGELTRGCRRYCA